MKSKSKFRRLTAALAALIFAASQHSIALAQCAMCRSSVQNAANDSTAQAAANTFNLAVLVLLIPPVVLFLAFFIVLLRYRRSADEMDAGRLKAAGAHD
jgi:heme/copper-type cytochrome/quinol oxidase subunit 2